ncbi:MAG: site-specific DNA-methyltransferase [Verrucomicrobiota bacterium]|jgi:site-specific DNA-methyltransferase (adenine-specific)
MISLNSVIRADILEVLPTFPTASAQSIIADPPYFNVLQNVDWDTQWDKLTEYLEWCDIWTSHCIRILKDDGLFFIFGQLGKREHGFIHLMSRLCRRYQFHDLLIWDRVVGYNERRDSFTPAYEMVLVLRKSGQVKFRKDAVRVPYDTKTIEMYLRDKRYKDRESRMRHLSKGKYATNILSVPSLKGSSKERCGHPSQKPVELITKLVLSSTDPGDLVFDPFLGSGTTAVVAEMHGRKWAGIEINDAYCAICEQRLQEVRGGLFTNAQEPSLETVALSEEASLQHKEI